MGNEDLICGGGKVELCGCPGFRGNENGYAQSYEDDYGYDDQRRDDCRSLEFGEGHMGCERIKASIEINYQILWTFDNIDLFNFIFCSY